MARNDAIEEFSRLYPKLGEVFSSIEISYEDTTLTKIDMLTLKILRGQEYVIMSELAKKQSIALSSATGIVDRLVKKGYINRGRSKTDRRIVKVSLAEKGTSLLNDLDRRGKVMIEKMLSSLEDQEQDEFIRILEKVVNALV